MSGSLIRGLVRFWADGKLTDRRPSDTETGSRGFPLQILSLPLLCSPPPRRPRPLFLSRGFVLARTRPRVFGCTRIYLCTCAALTRIGVRVDVRGGSAEPPPQPAVAARASMPANLYWFLPSNTQSDIFLLRQSTRLTPTQHPPPPRPRIVRH